MSSFAAKSGETVNGASDNLIETSDDTDYGHGHSKRTLVATRGPSETVTAAQLTYADRQATGRRPNEMEKGF
jgi:hypothetical protein